VPAPARGGQARCPHHKGVDSPSLTHRDAGLDHRSPAWSLRPDAQSAWGPIACPTAVEKETPQTPEARHAYTSNLCNVSTYFAPLLCAPPRLIPELEKTGVTAFPVM